MKKTIPMLLLLAAGLLAVLVTTRAPAQNVLQYGFETREPIWVKGGSDAPYRETAHRLTDETAHTGTRSELIALEAEKGTFIHYTYDVGRAPIVDELALSVWVKSNRLGPQLLARVVLPRERDPHNLDQPLAVLLPGDPYTTTSRWQPLKVHQPVKRLREQQQLLRAQLRRDVNIDGAYVDRLVLNVYGGPGSTQVWTDDLEVGPLDESVPRGPGRVESNGPTPGTPVSNPGPGGQSRGGSDTVQSGVNQRAVNVALVHNQLRIGYVRPTPGNEGNAGQEIFMRAIRHTGTPLKALQVAGFNTVFLDETTPPGLLEDAVNLGFWIVPSLRLPDERSDGALASLDAATQARIQAGRDAFGRKLAALLKQEAVLFWYLGDSLTFEQYRGVARTAEAITRADPDRPIAADVQDGFHRYAQIPQLLMGMHRWPLMTGLDMIHFDMWLIQRRQLAKNPPYTWTWIQTHLPDWYTALAYDQEGPAAGGPAKAAPEPMGPQPEQIRLLAYTAIGAGVRGLGFWSDRYLADPTTGRDRLLALALLNQELQMLEPLLCTATEHTWIDTSVPNVKAAVMHCKNAVLVLPIWMGAGAQFVPGQSSSISVDITVPHVPDGCQCWEVSPGDLHSLRWERVVGGVKVTLHEFSMAAPLVFTSDLTPNGMVVHLQDHQRSVGRLAAQWACDLAVEELKKVEQVQIQLAKAGQALADERELLEKCRGYLETAAAHRKNGDWSDAYADAERAMRPLRIYMRGHWEKATKEMTTPLASPYALSFYTLPRHWQFWKEVKQSRVGANLLKDGGFEKPPTEVQEGWLRQEAPSLDEVIAVARRVSEKPYCEGKQCLMLQVKPRNLPEAPTSLERTCIAVHTPEVQLKPGSLVQITASMRIPTFIAGSADGALFFDSIGGEQMALRFTGGLQKWKKFVLYRRVPASGKISLTMALTGMGTVYFDDVRIEPLTYDPNAPSSSAQPTANQPR